MDNRLVVTMSYVAHLVAGGVLAIAYLSTDAAFTDGQGTFLLGVGYIGPAVGLVFCWARNYALGAALYVGTTASTGWFSLYFFFLHDGPASVFEVGGDASAAYALGAVAVVVISFVAALLGSWLWYRESPGFRTVVRSLLQPTDASD